MSESSLPTATKVAKGCDPDDRACAAALRALVDARTKLQKQRRARGGAPDFGLMSIAEYMNTRHPTKRERLIADPLVAAMNLGIREVGEYLFATGGIRRMRRVCDAAAGPRSNRFQRRAGMIDHQWDGIGNKWWT